MLFIRKRQGVIQNVGWLNRTFRFVVGTIMIAYPCYLFVNTGTITDWGIYSMLIAIYPLLSGILGWDPIYASMEVRSCDTSNRNLCGTITEELDSTFGQHTTLKP